MNPFRVNKRGALLVLHLAFWCLLFLVPVLLGRAMDRPEGPPPEVRRNFQILFFISILSWMSLFYWNGFWLLPRIFFRKRYGAYLLTVLCTLLLLSLVNYLSQRLLLPEHKFYFAPFLIFYIFPCLFMLATSTAYRMLLDRLESDRRDAQRETMHLKTELDFLRSQVSPHFMFNVLNNMVALARKKSDQLEPSLIKLSSLLRYMLYETDEDKVPLEKEIDYLQSYIDLQQQRFNKQVEVEAGLDEVDGSYEIAPMLLIPFVENAFKHGTGLVQRAQIRIRLQAKEGGLHFTVANRYLRDASEIKDKTSGIGLSNVARRLNLIYPDRHALTILEEADWYSVTLVINLN